ncbi:MAG TPA: cell wall-binding repeat-containing protein [Solirubrobacterales bacterium]|nr:cell wall-binding repeat-containing protein [Solirubrobacterales bacterium]
MLKRVRYFFSDVIYWVREHAGRSLAAVFLLVILVAGGVFAGTQLAGDDARIDPGPAPEVFVGQGVVPEEPAELGFPAFATRNTTRVAGPDSAANAAGVALATFPRGGVVKGPGAVTLVDDEDWAGGIAASQLVAEPIGAPILMTTDGELGELTAGALESLNPTGNSATGGAQAFKVGDAGEADGLDTRAVEGSNAAEIAVEALELREKLVGDPPEHLLIASSDDPESAMPAAAWAARSGDPVLFAQSDSVPSPTLKAIERLEDVPIFILGSGDVISNAAEKQIADATESEIVRAAEEDDPVLNAISFARFTDGTFGWNINDPGHGFVIANLERPSDAAAAAALSGTGTWGPLLLTDDAKALPAALEGYLLDLKPGYEDDPTRAVYNHIWLIGDEDSLSVDAQVELDEIAEVARVESGTGDDILGADAEPEPETRGDPDNEPEKPKDDEDQ